MDMLQRMNIFGRMQKVVHHKVKYQSLWRITRRVLKRIKSQLAYNYRLHPRVDKIRDKMTSKTPALKQ